MGGGILSDVFRDDVAGDELEPSDEEQEAAVQADIRDRSLAMAAKPEGGMALMPEAARKILLVMADPDMVGKTTNARIKAANVTRDEYYRWMNDPQFLAVADATIEDALAGVQRELVAISLKYARKGNRYHHEFLAKLTGLKPEDKVQDPVTGNEKSVVPGTEKRIAKKYLTETSAVDLEHYADTGVWRAKVGQTADQLKEQEVDIVDGAVVNDGDDSDGPTAAGAGKRKRSD